MKIKNVYDQIFSMDNLYEAYEKAIVGRRYKPEILDYSFDTWSLLTELREKILRGDYEIDKYRIFFVYEPKKRMIMSIKFEHRVVQWAIYRVVNPMLVNGYINDSFGCIPGRGAVGAMKRLKGWVDYVDRKAGEWYYLKLDISKYFYRISHSVLKRILAKKIKDTRLLEVLYGVIDCEHTPFGLPKGMSPEDVPMEERLYDVGMPIGNLLSQMFANLYLNALDWFCKRTLSIKYYVRYMDDVIILHDKKEELGIWKIEIEEFLETELELQLNNKTCMRPVSHGIEFVGYRIKPHSVTLRKSTSLRIKRNLKGVRKGYKEYRLTLREATVTFTSYIGMLSHTDSEELLDKLYSDMILTHGGESIEKEEFICVQPQKNDWHLLYE